MRTPDGLNFVAAIKSDACPGCGRSWWMFPPVKIDGQQTMHRCIECKRVYEFVAREVDELNKERDT